MKHKLYYQIGALAIGLLLIAGLQQAMAQNARNLSLDEAIQLSLQSSKQLKLSQAKVDEATAVLRQARESQLPDVKASGAYLRVDNPTVDLKVKLGGGSSSGSSSGESGSNPASSIKVNQALYGLVNASLPIFSGLRIHYGIESAKYLAQASKLDAESDRQGVIQNTINAYDNLYKASETVNIVKGNLKQNQQRVSDFSNMEKNGILARNDLLKAELGESNVELTLLDAENNLKIATINMNLMLGLPEGTDLIPDSGAVEQMNDAGSIADWEQTALTNRKDMASLNMREKASSANIKSIKGEYYPGLAITGGYVAVDIPNLLTIYNAVDGGIGVQYSLSSLWKTGAKVAQARAQQQQIIQNENILSDAIRLQINQAYENYLLSQKKIEVYAKAKDQADENYKITKNKYDNSLVTTTDLLDADVAQLQASLNYTFSKVDAIVAYKKLQQTAGVLSYNNQTTNK